MMPIHSVLSCIMNTFGCIRGKCVSLDTTHDCVNSLIVVYWLYGMTCMADISRGNLSLFNIDKTYEFISKIHYLIMNNFRKMNVIIHKNEIASSVLK